MATKGYYRAMDRFALHGWKGWLEYVRSFSAQYTSKEIASERPNVLLLYRHLHKLIRAKVYRYGTKELKKSELRVLFKEAKSLTDLQDIRLCYNVGRLVQERLETGEYPPFPRVFMEPYSIYHEKEKMIYRKFIKNIESNDVILEPGQDPPRHWFFENKQFHRDYCTDPEIVKYETTGIQFENEEKLLSK